jgi:AraC-like DNA-binding protein
VAVVLRSHMVPLFVRRARRLGVGVDDLVARHRIDPAAEEVRISCAGARAVCDAIAERASDPHFGFHAALEMPRGAYGLIEYVVRNTPTVRALSGQLLRFSRLINAQLLARFDEVAGRIEERIEGEPECLGAQGNVFSLTHQLEVVRDASAARLVPDRVYFAHPKPAAPDDVVAAHFGTRDVVYGCGFNGVDLGSRVLDTPLAGADPSLLRVLETRARELAAELERGDELDGVRRAIAAELERGEPTAKRVAAAVGTSERTLHRRIGAHGTTFGALVDRMRHELALGYLGDPARTVTDVALLLGYSDGRAFARAFRRWTQMTPVEWRHRRPAPPATSKR